MVKAYLRYEHVQTFGVVASGQASLVSSGEDDTIVAPALEALHLWHVRKVGRQWQCDLLVLEFAVLTAVVFGFICACLRDGDRGAS